MKNIFCKNALFAGALLLSAALCSRALSPARAQNVAPQNAAAPEVSLQLGAQNIGNGLQLFSAGDGINAPETVGGSAARRTVAPSLYFYFAVTDPSLASTREPRDLYITVEVFDDLFRRVGLQYDKAAAQPNINTFYTPSPDSALLLGTDRWRTVTFFLPQARLGKAQNNGADFRIDGGANPGAGPGTTGIAIRRVTVSTQRPASYQSDGGIDRTALNEIRVTRPQPGLQFTFGNDATAQDAALYKALGVTSVESYVDWAGVEPQQGKWDWSKWDKQVAILKKAGLKWTPFLIAGPPYATPKWFQKSAAGKYYKCLEHNEESGAQSLWNPQLHPQVTRFLRAFSARYGQSGMIESVLLGISGIYGESIYPAGPEGDAANWTSQVNGPFHNHIGWWAADSLAIAAFRAAMQKRYVTIAALNAAWKTTFTSFAQVKTFLPDKAPSDRARFDFVEWYQSEMTDFAAFWAREARRAMPSAEIQLCTGGDGNPILGADFTAQAKAVAPFGVGVRITNEGSDYVGNFAVTREVATATRLYKTFCSFEPASAVDANGIVGRIYNATASDVRQLHDYNPNPLASAASLQNLRANLKWLTPRTPRVLAAWYLPRESYAVDATTVGLSLSLSRPVRDLMDLDFVTRRSVQDSALNGKRVLVMPPSPVIEPNAARAIENWVRAGGTLIFATRRGETPGARLFQNAAWRAALLPKPGSDAGALAKMQSFALQGAAPLSWSLDVGDAADEQWLDGDWWGREAATEWPNGQNATKRWSGSRSVILLPMQPNPPLQPARQYSLRLSLAVPPEAVRSAPVIVAVDGKTVARITKSGVQEIVASIFAPQNKIARLEIRTKTWKPSERGSVTDERALGVAVRSVSVVARELENMTPIAATPDLRVQRKLDAAALNRFMRRVGKGRVVLLPGAADDTRLFGSVLESLIGDKRSMPDIAPLFAADARLDNRYVTLTTNGVLRFDMNTATISSQ